jgi:DNA repair photolyase
MEQPKKPPVFSPPVRGRGAGENTSGRFERLTLDVEAETYNDLCVTGDEEAERQIKTEIYRDTSRTVVSTNDSPDIGMEVTLNPYRGCEHGCIYCYARPTHEYLGLSAGLDFESKIFAKPDAAQLLEKKLQSPSWQPKVLTLSGVTDCYQPAERKLRITRACLEVLRDFRNPAAIITKNHLVTRDIDIFREMTRDNTISVNISVTTLDGDLARKMEPRASQPAMRLRAIEMLAKENIPVGIMIGPVLPGLTEHEIPDILKAVADAGARVAHYTMLRLPYGVKDLFQSWLKEHYPDRAEKILNRVRDMRGGKLYNAEFGTRMTGEGFYADQIAQIFALYRKKYNLNRYTKLSSEGFNRDARNPQRDLFG